MTGSGPLGSHGSSSTAADSPGPVASVPPAGRPGSAGGTRTDADGTDAGGTRVDAGVEGRTLLSGLLLGLGVAAFVDETVFHQLLHWHHFYDKSTPAAGLVSDGVFHAVSWFATVAAIFLLVDVRRRGPVPVRRWWGGLLLAAGAFQLYDGTVQHKLLDLHEIRYGVDLRPYDWVWNVIAVLLLLAGAALLARSRTRTR